MHSLLAGQEHFSVRHFFVPSSLVAADGRAKFFVAEFLWIPTALSHKGYKEH
jgi:hypothetical protein